MELIHAALRFAYAVEMRVKLALNCRRPHEYSPQMQPIIACPLHGSLPSGHATEAFLFAHLLAVLSTGKESLHGRAGQSVWVNQLMRQANRIAVNRTVAGVHFPVDSVAGCLLGLTLAEYLVKLCEGKQDGEEQGFRSCEFRGMLYPMREEDPNKVDFIWQNFYDVDQNKLNVKKDAIIERYASVLGASHPLPKPSKQLEWLWKKAKDEWSESR
jgi:hypothetical protein